jgi:SAM-dependent methyltransferase
MMASAVRADGLIGPSGLADSGDAVWRAEELTRPMNTHHTEDITDEAVVAAAEELAERLIESLVPALELLTVEFGRRLGLYAAIAAHPSVDALELSQAAAIHPRVAREWLEQQATAGFLDVLDAGADPERRRFTLPTGHAAVLLDPESPAFAIGAATMFSGTAGAFESVVAAAATGRGVSYGAFGAGVRHGLQQLNRPGFVGDLDDWLTWLPDITARLSEGGRILDLGCGTGWSSVALARLFPAATVVGVDLDEASITEARALAAEQGLTDRLRFECADATDRHQLAALIDGPADLVTIFEALHDMNEPRAALEAARAVLGDSGAVFVGDERVAEEFGAEGDFLERLNYGFSVLHCLPATMAEGAGTANGTVLRPATVLAWAADAGFSGATVLGIEHPFWRFYRIDR